VVNLFLNARGDAPDAKALLLQSVVVRVPFS